jgi:hypothetical protein
MTATATATYLAISAHSDFSGVSNSDGVDCGQALEQSPTPLLACSEYGIYPEPAGTIRPIPED